ncbi:hypothetical protein ACJX0J_011423, partial [Zea mays]
PTFVPADIRKIQKKEEMKIVESLIDTVPFSLIKYLGRSDNERVDQIWNCVILSSLLINAYHTLTTIRNYISCVILPILSQMLNDLQNKRGMRRHV